MKKKLNVLFVLLKKNVMKSSQILLNRSEISRRSRIWVACYQVRDHVKWRVHLFWSQTFVNLSNVNVHFCFKGFEDLQKAYTKASPVISKEENGQTPRFYTRILVELEDFINEMWEDREGRKNLNKNNR